MAKQTVPNPGDPGVDPLSDMRVVADHVLEDPETSEMVTRLEAEADREIAEHRAGVVTLRWGRSQIETVKTAAALMGLPYQTYLKQVVFRQALADITQAEAIASNKRVGAASGQQEERA